MSGLGSTLAVSEQTESFGVSVLKLGTRQGMAQMGGKRSLRDAPGNDRDGSLSRSRKQQNGYVSLRRIALVESDLPGLPAFDAATKTADSRHQRFVARFGADCYELDAMPPPQLRDRVRIEIERLIDWRAWQGARLEEQEELRRLHDICDNEFRG